MASPFAGRFPVRIQDQGPDLLWGQISSGAMRPTSAVSVATEDPIFPLHSSSSSQLSAKSPAAEYLLVMTRQKAEASILRLSFTVRR